MKIFVKNTEKVVIFEFSIVNVHHGERHATKTTTTFIYFHIHCYYYSSRKREKCYRFDGWIAKKPTTTMLNFLQNVRSVPGWKNGFFRQYSRWNSIIALAVCGRFESENGKSVRFSFLFFCFQLSIFEVQTWSSLVWKVVWCIIKILSNGERSLGKFIWRIGSRS